MSGQPRDTVTYEFRVQPACLRSAAAVERCGMDGRMRPSPHEYRSLYAIC